MHVIHTQNELIKTLKTLPHIAFVPTMGNLHEGHIKLIQEALKKNKTYCSEHFYQSTSI